MIDSGVVEGWMWMAVPPGAVGEDDDDGRGGRMLRMGTSASAGEARKSQSSSRCVRGSGTILRLILSDDFTVVDSRQNNLLERLAFLLLYKDGPDFQTHRTKI